MRYKGRKASFLGRTKVSPVHTLQTIQAMWDGDRHEEVAAPGRNSTGQEEKWWGWEDFRSMEENEC
jgi:hypothetical protein